MTDVLLLMMMMMMMCQHHLRAVLLIFWRSASPGAYIVSALRCYAARTKRQTRAVRRRRRRRPNVGVSPAPFSWRVHVMLYTSYMLLDFCNAVYNEAWTLTKSSKNDAGVFRNSPCYLLKGNMAASKQSVFVDNFVKMISDAKSFIWNFFGNLVNRADGTEKVVNSVYCNNCLKGGK